MWDSNPLEHASFAWRTSGLSPGLREKPSYFLVQIQSMNLGFLAYFLEEEEEEREEDNIVLYLTLTHEDPDLSFRLYIPVPAGEAPMIEKRLLICYK